MVRRSRQPPPKSLTPSSDARAGATFIESLVLELPSPLPSVLRSDLPTENRVVPVVGKVSQLPWLPSSLARGQVPRLPSPARPPVGGGRAYSRLLAGLQRAHALHRYSSPCQARKTRSEVLHALGIAGRRGVGRGKPRRMSKFSNVRCR